MAELIMNSEDFFIKNEVEDALPGDSEKTFQSPNHLSSPKHEKVPWLNLPSISGPYKFEYETQKLEPKGSDHEEAEDALPGDSEKPFHFPNHLLSQKSLDLPSISGPCEFKYYTQEWEPKCSTNEGDFSPQVSGLDLHENLSPVVPKNLSTSDFSNACASESEGKGLKNQKRCLKIYLQNEKNKKSKRYQRTDNEKKKYNCEVCEKTFFRLHDLTRHQRVHTGEKPFKCCVCDKTFSDIANLNRHQRVHTGEKPFKCNVCDKTFSHGTNLNMHQRVHTGEKPFNCNVCDKTFSRAATLRTHKRMHTGEKPFKCDICDQVFSQAANLITHQRIHTGKKPFTCEICKKGFSRPGSLNSHQRVHTPIKLRHLFCQGVAN